VLSRVGSALDQLAAAVVTLAVFALPISLLFLGHTRHDLWLLVGIALAFVTTGVAVARLGALYGGPGNTVLRLLGAGAVTWAVGFFAAVIGYSIEINSSLCGHRPATAVAYIGAVVVYAIIGSWALTGTGARFFAGPSLGAVLGIAWALVALAVLPGGHGYCET
jgi:hypothetical protein